VILSSDLKFKIWNSATRNDGLFHDASHGHGQQQRKDAPLTRLLTRNYGKESTKKAKKMSQGSYAASGAVNMTSKCLIGYTTASNRIACTLHSVILQRRLSWL
jgi:hypothetical protein